MPAPTVRFGASHELASRLSSVSTGASPPVDGGHVLLKTGILFFTQWLWPLIPPAWRGYVGASSLHFDCSRWSTRLRPSQIYSPILVSQAAKPSKCGTLVHALGVRTHRSVAFYQFHARRVGAGSTCFAKVYKYSTHRNTHGASGNHFRNTKGGRRLTPPPCRIPYTVFDGTTEVEG